MTTYRIKVGYHNPNALTFRQLDAQLADHAFYSARANDDRGGFRYFQEYEYSSDSADYCAVCSLAYHHACQVKKCPLVLVEIKQSEPET
ncbi:MULTISPECIES: hypothetical protein [Pantoea]|uniref:Uncharacterized protein n=2 Tax=Pantoea stewartii TaxID=66269 RepID=A0AB34VHJ5_9GAMM|nr:MULTISPECIES: hypothetical protein [Pantoea]KKW51139.1 hypothetical protein XB02_08065 [Pantoea ananatis]ARF49853.1 hypothetical protein DSJ_11185 [Pantoea stewartii subsp. stewartii DC283]KAB0545369.1 hypothetical protein F7Q90_25150 [Pantoea stewartii subsp. stewartii]KGD84988.1 hypothetical protein HA47_01850 [Pantoea stewartii subsp. indologenes]KTS75684.1 hypothetical protein RSA30_02540 [Pantoea stewartii]